MAIYHLEAKIVSRGAGRSAVAAAVYLSCSRMLNEYDGVQHDYTRKQGLGWRQVFLPATAPAEWQDRETLWNAVEETETAKDSRLAREFVAALPIELSREEQKLERYMGLVQQIKEKTKGRKNLLAEKKETPFYQIPKLRDLARRIAELTEELEELQTEKEMLLRSLDCADDTGISSVKKDIAAMESALKKLEEQEAKYSAELDAALKEYSELKEQASELDAGELMEARLAIREEKERSAVTCVQDAYGEKYDSLMMFDSKRDVANLLHEEAETRSVRERLRKKQQTKTQRQRKPKHYEQER